MIYTYPDNLKKFVCVAGECTHTCCRGWQVEIDSKSLAKYKRLMKEKRIPRSFYWKMKRGIDFKKEVFGQTKGQCAFLDQEQLCTMYKVLGKESLCLTCATYPRNNKIYENRREIGLSFSCPEIVRMIFSQEEPLEFVEEEKEEQEECWEDFDYFLFDKVLDSRQFLIALMQNRTFTVESRRAIALSYASAFQINYQQGRLFQVEELLEKYHKEETWSLIEQKKGRTIKGSTEREYCEKWFQARRDLFCLMNELEVLKKGWKLHLRNLERILYRKGSWYYGNLYYAFVGEMKEKKQWDYWKRCQEHLVTMLVFTYISESVYDGNLLGKVQFGIYSCFVLEELLLYQWCKSGIPSKKDIEEMVVLYFREVEHSDNNMSFLQEAFAKDDNGTKLLRMEGFLEP